MFKLSTPGVDMTFLSINQQDGFEISKTNFLDNMSLFMHIRG